MSAWLWVPIVAVAIIVVGRMIQQEADWTDVDHDDDWPYAPKDRDRRDGQ